MEVAPFTATTCTLGTGQPGTGHYRMGMPGMGTPPTDLPPTDLPATGMVGMGMPDTRPPATGMAPMEPPTPPMRTRMVMPHPLITVHTPATRPRIFIPMRAARARPVSTDPATPVTPVTTRAAPRAKRWLAASVSR